MLSFLLSLYVHLIPLLRNIERREGKSSFHGNSMQRISMRPAYCKSRVLPFLQSEFSIAQLCFCKDFSFGEKLLLQQSTCDDKGHAVVVAADDDELLLFGIDSL